MKRLFMGTGAVLFSLVCVPAFAQVGVFVSQVKPIDDYVMTRGLYSYAPDVIYVDGIYHMYWCGGVGDKGDYILHAQSTSPRGPFLAGGKNPPNPQYDVALKPSFVVGSSAFDAFETCDPSVMKVGNTFYLYYGGLRTTSNTIGSLNAIGVAKSTDGIAFTRANNGQPIYTSANPNPPTTNKSLDYGAGQPAVFYIAPYYYLSFSDTTAPGSDPVNGAGQYMMRSLSPMFDSGDQELVGPGQWASRLNGVHTGKYKYLEAASIDIAYDTASKRIFVASDQAAGQQWIYVLDPLTFQSQGTMIMSGGWVDGPGIVKNADRTMFGRHTCGSVTFEIYKGECSTSPCTTNNNWDIAISEATFHLDSQLCPVSGTISVTGTGFASNPDGTPDLIAMDVNGDGKTDLVQVWNRAGKVSLISFIANGTGFTNGGVFNSVNGYASASDGTPDLIAMDINGDGRMDLVQQWNDGGYLVLIPYISTENGFVQGNALFTNAGYATASDGTPDLIAMDINGDGKMDLVQQWNNGGEMELIIYMSNGNGFYFSGAYEPGTSYASGSKGTPGLIAMDINGDGKTDLVQQVNNGGYLALIPFISNGSTFDAGALYQPGYGYASAIDGTPDLIAMDINGDGKMDLVQQWDEYGSLTLITYLSTGNSFTVGAVNTPGYGYASGPNGTPGLIAMDFDGDGKMDLVQQWNNYGQLTLINYRSNGTGFDAVSTSTPGSGYASGPGYTPGLLKVDINGDGKMDLVQQSSVNGGLGLIPLISNGISFLTPN